MQSAAKVPILVAFQVCRMMEVVMAFQTCKYGSGLLSVMGCFMHWLRLVNNEFRLHLDLIKQRHALPSNCLYCM